MSAAGAVSGILVYSLATQRYQRLTGFGSCPHWLSDNRRLLFVHQGKLHLIDSPSGRIREVLSVAPNEIRPHNLALSRDDRMVYFIVENTAADIWLMNLP